MLGIVAIGRGASATDPFHDPRVIAVPFATFSDEAPRERAETMAHAASLSTGGAPQFVITHEG